MAHSVDGFELKFTSRTSWKAERRKGGKLIDVLPVTWTKGLRRSPETNETFLQVWYRDPVEMAEQARNPEPFVIALAEARDYAVLPHEFKTFKAVFEVSATGDVVDAESIRTRVLRRLMA